MKKAFKKIASLVLCVALVSIFPAAIAEDGAFFSDTIEDHAIYVPVGSLGQDYDNNVPGVASGKGDILVPGVWQVSSMFGGGAWATDYRVRYDMQYANAWNDKDLEITTDKVLSIKSLSSADNIQAAINLIEDVSDVGDNFVYQADIRTYFNGNSTPVMGMRIADPENEANYYEIALFNNTGVANSKDEAKVSAPRFTKVKGADINTPAIAAEGSEPATWLYTKYGEEATVSGLYHAGSVGYKTDWFTITFGRQGNVFSWTVAEKETGTVVWKDKWEDASPLFEGVGTLQLFEYGGGNGSTFVNNITLDAVAAPVVTSPLDIFDDDIEDHPLYVPVGSLGQDYDNNVPGVASGKNDVLVPGVWVTSPIFGGKSWSSDYRVRYDTWLGNGYTSKDYDLADKVIAIKSLAKDDRWQAAINRIGDVSEVGDNYIYSADLRSYFDNGASSLVMGMRIFDPSNETNYYEIALINNTDTAADKEAAKVSAPRFTKVQGGSDLNTPNVAEVGSEPATWLYTEYGTNKTASGIYKQANGYETEWFTVKLGRQGNTFIWSVEEKETGEVIWTDSWTDANPLFDGCGTLQLFEYSGTEGGSGRTFINNVSLKKLGVEIYRESGVVTDKVSDDMQGHTVWETVSGNYGIDSDNGVPGVATGSGKQLATNWKTSKKFGGVSWATLYEVAYEEFYCNSYNDKDYLTDNIVLSMRPIDDDENRQTALNFEIGTDDSADSYTYSAVLRAYFKGRTTPIMGMRLSNPDDETEYYELALFNNTGVANSEEESHVNPPRFTKVSGAVIDTPAMAESGAEPASWLYCEYGDKPTASGLYPPAGGKHSTHPHTLTISRDGDTFTWSVVNNSTGEVVWEDAWYDNDPLFDKTAKLQVFAYGDSREVYVDDVSYVAKEEGGIKMQSVWYNPSQLAPMLVIGNYDSTGRLADCTVCPTTDGLFGEYKSGALEMTAETMKAFIWDGVTLTPLAKESKFVDFKISTSEITFPSYTKKAATFSFDGDADYNTQVAGLMANYGIDATFNLGAASDNAIYKNNNFEVANGTTGAEIYLTEEYINENGETVAPPTYEQSLASIDDAASSIGTKFVTPRGFAWAYMAPEERSFCGDLITYLEENGYEYARDIHTNGSFKAPANWMDWHQTTWMSADLKDEVVSYADKLAKMPAPAEFQILSVIDRTENMEDADRLAAYEAVFAKISDDGIWKATNLEISEYVKAAQQVEFTSTYAYNPSDITVYMLINGNRYVALPQSYAVRAY